MIKTIFLVGVIATFAGCATNNNWSWYKEGATTQDFNMDNGQCRAQAFSIPGAPLLQVLMVQQSCMQGKGWVKQVNN